jgi:hypothetical protein
MRIKGGWLHSSGDRDRTDGDLDNFANIDAYMGGFGSVVVFDSLADDSTLASAPFIADRGLNMPYLAVDYDMTDKTSFGISYLHINTDTNIRRADGTKGAKDLGQEIAVRASHKITKNLTAAIESGYLIGGDAWDNLATNTGAAGPPVIPADTRADADNVLRTDVSIRYKF